MSITREPIFVALNAQLQPLVTNATIKTLTRRLKHFSDVEPSERPYVCITQGIESIPKRKRGTPGVYTLRAKIYIYVSTSGGQTPATVLNPILDAIQSAIEPGMPDTNTLGGLVQECWIEGDIETFEGTLGDDEVAIVPIYMTVSG
jgi:hypothetical protein